MAVATYWYTPAEQLAGTCGAFCLAILAVSKLAHPTLEVSYEFHHAREVLQGYGVHSGRLQDEGRLEGYVACTATRVAREEDDDSIRAPAAERPGMS